MWNDYNQFVSSLFLWALLSAFWPQLFRWTPFSYASIYTICGSSGVVAKSCPTLWGLVSCSPPGSFGRWVSPGKNTGVGSHFLLQNVFPTQGSNACLLHSRQICYQTEPSGKLFVSLSYTTQLFRFRSLKMNFFTSISATSCHYTQNSCNLIPTVYLEL